MSLFQLNSHPITNLRWQIIDEDKKFPGYFQVKILDETIEIADRCLIKKINDEMDLLSGYDAPPETVKRERLMKARQTTSRNIKYIAEQFSAHSYGDERNPSLEIGRWIGKFQAVNEFINQREFAEFYDNQKDKIVTLHIAQLPDDTTPEQQSLIVELCRAQTVVEIVLEGRRKTISASAEADQQVFSSDDLYRQRRFYLQELKDIADDALSSKSTDYARNRLVAFKDAFVAREADRVKNQHMRKLGKWSIIFGLSFLILSFILGNLGGLLDGIFAPGNAQILSNFFLLGAGACGGTWLSFSLRKTVLGFDDLASLEEDRLYPIGRLSFVALLAGVFGLFIQLKIIEASIGQIPIVLHGPFMIILIGVMFGIGERSLSSVISSKAEGFFRQGDASSLDQKASKT